MFGMFNKTRRIMFGASLCAVLLFGSIPTFGSGEEKQSNEPLLKVVPKKFNLMLRKNKGCLSQSYEYREVTHLGSANEKDLFQFSNKNGWKFYFNIKDIKKIQECSKTLLQKVLLKIKRCDKKGKSQWSKGRACNRWLLLDDAGQKFIDYCKEKNISTNLNEINYEKGSSLSSNEFIVKMRKRSRIPGMKKGFSWSYAVRKVIYDTKDETYRFVYKDAKKVFRFEWTAKDFGTECDGTVLIEMKRRKNKILLARDRYLLLDYEGRRFLDFAKFHSPKAIQNVRKGDMNWSFTGDDVTTIEEGGTLKAIQSTSCHSDILENKLTVANGLILLTGQHHYLFKYLLERIEGQLQGIKHGILRYDEDKDEDYPELQIDNLPMMSRFIETIKTEAKRIQQNGKLEFLGKPFSLDCLVSYLSSMAEFPDTTRIGVVREVKRKTGETAKPAWAAGLMLKMNATRARGGPEIKYVIDFGTNKMALTDFDGNQIEDFYASYKDEKTTNVKFTKGKNKSEKVTIGEYLKRVKEYLTTKDLSCENIAARFTGDWRLDNQKEHIKTKKNNYMAELDNFGINHDFLDIREEATFGSQHMLDIAGPYIADYNKNRSKREMITHVRALESGSGSIQGVKYVLRNRRRRLKSPSGVEALENLLDQCDEQAYYYTN